MGHVALEGVKSEDLGPTMSGRESRRDFVIELTIQGHGNIKTVGKIIINLCN
jgi:hypothetical protein